MSLSLEKLELLLIF